MNKLPNNLHSPKTLLLPLVFILSWTYWLFLLNTTSMIIIFDGATYKTTAQMIADQGWIMYFRTGPHNEPIYPALIAFAMRLAKHLPFTYEKILTSAQILILFTTQLLSLQLFKKLKLNYTLSACLILYIGFSPALVNAAFSHWSEITALPFTLGLILLSCRAWRLINTNEQRESFLTGIYCAMICIGLVSIKAIFEYIFPIYFLVFIILSIKCYLNKDRSKLKNILFFILPTLCLFYAFIFGYKSINKHFNDHFIMADRGPYIVYGNVIKRTDHPLTARNLGASLAIIPGDNICNKLFGSQECNYWKLQQVDYFGQGKLNELRKQGIAEGLLDQTLLNMAKDQIKQHPIQYGSLTALESLKIFFWESTHIGYVTYPPVLTKVFDYEPFKNSLRLILSLSSVFALLFGINYVIKNFDQLWRKDESSITPIIFMLIFIVPFAAFYSFFFIHTRYIFPIVPFHLALIGFWLQNRTQIK